MTSTGINFISCAEEKVVDCNYKLSINYSEPQTVNINNHFYIKDRRPSKSPKSQSRFKSNTCSKKFSNSLTPNQILIDNMLTKKIKENQNFDEIINDPLFQSLYKK